MTRYPEEPEPIDLPIALTPLGGFVSPFPSNAPLPADAAPPAGAPASPAPASGPIGSANASDADGFDFEEPPEPAAAQAAAPRALLGERYQLERELARGAMGRVYLATQLGLNRKVAIKVMSPKLIDPDFLRRFTLEAKGLANLNHNNIVTVYDHGESKKGMPYLVLEYLEGETISAALRREGPFSVQRAVGVVGQLLRGLRAAHRKGIIHRDLKPSNVFLVKNDDGEEEVKILDFGIAKLVAADGRTEDATREGALLGTPAYMAPEQIDGGAVDARTDLYALGCVLFHLLSGRVPFPGKNDIEILHGHLKQPAPALRSMPGCEPLPVELEGFVGRLLAKSAADRPADANAALAELRELVANLVTVDGTLRARMSANLLSVPTGRPGSTSNGSSSTGSDAAAALKQIADGSSANLDRSVLAAASPLLVPAPAELPSAAPPPPTMAAPKRTSPFLVAASVAAALGLGVGFALWSSGNSVGHRLVVETIPDGLDLIAADGRILGRSPVTIEHDRDTIEVRARIGNALSEPQRLRSFDGRVLGDFSAWARTLAAPKPPAASSLPSTAPADAVASPPAAALPAVSERTPTPTESLRRRSRSAAPAEPVGASEPSPPPASTKTAVPLLDERPVIAPIDNEPGIGLLDDAPRVAPID